ncbi:putative nuclease HARBI1 [Haliotis rubra]|uniref:putative nuclease HARBI1 n=1 Tax=Haliotis rubra TaxID=36100 RepID=UPI001EE53411|nr:putative nuclease HARBI1 [Haliotis rubra]
MLDGSYIPIPGPSFFRDSYICRKGFPAMHLQGVCDSSLKFIDVYCAYPGSAHDSRVYRNSPLCQYLEDNPLPEMYHLLGDSAYALSKSLLVPFRDNGHLTAIEKTFNNAHSSTRVDIERCFGLLKGKFRKLKYLDMKNVREMPEVIITCCVLHNFILTQESFDESDIDTEDIDAVETEAQSERDPQELKSVSEKRMEIAHLLV